MASESIRSRFLYHLGSSAMPKVKARILYGKHPEQAMFHYTKCQAEDVATLESILIDCFGPTSNDAKGIKLDENMNNPIFCCIEQNIGLNFSYEYLPCNEI